MNTLHIYNLNSHLYPYLQNYKQYLPAQDAIIDDIRLTNQEELKKLGCSAENNTCNDAYNFVYSTSYRSMTPEGNDKLWSVYTNKNFIAYTANGVMDFGVRPVITISKSHLQN